MPRRRRDPGGYGGAHASRTDLTQPTRVASGQQYGERQAQEQAQRAVPLPRVAVPSAPAAGVPPPPGTPAAAAAAAAAEQRALGAATAFDFQPVGLGAPSQRPGEPVTAGIGSPSLGPFGGVNPDLLALQPYLPALEQMAALPDASVAMRNFVRRLRGAVPPEVQ